MKHVTLFSLSVIHPFYDDGRCRDFDLEPTAATRRLLRNHRLILRPGSDGLQILTPLDDSGNAFLPLPENTAFVFHLVSRNRDFDLFTDLAAVSARPAPLFTDAGVTPGAPLRLTSWETATAGFGRDVFADVEVHAGGAELVEQKFRLVFAAKLALWAYYCVTDLRNGGPLALVDATPVSQEAPLLFSDANRRELNESPDPEDRIAVQLAARYGDLRRIRFLSDQAVACREIPGRRLELHQETSGHPLRLSGPLPLPPLQSYSTVVTAAGGAEDSLYQVFKYLTEPVT